jgi:predicted ArsR family transcriptional regulator
VESSVIDRLKEKVFQKEQLLLQSRAGLAMVMVEHFGEEAEQVIRDFLDKGTREWAAGAAEADRQAGRANDIQGLIDFLWEPLREEGFEFTCEQRNQGYQMHVTKCPVAEIAHKFNLEKWGFIFYCCGDEAIAEGYNPKIAFKRTETLMAGDAYCDHFYGYREAPE